MCMSKIWDSRKLTDDNKKRKRKPRVVVICSCNKRKQAFFTKNNIMKQTKLHPIPIEIRDSKEVEYISGFSEDQIKSVRIMPEDSSSMNFSFDVTPSKFVTGLITPRGVCKANETDILKLFPEFDLLSLPFYFLPFKKNY